MTQSTIITIGDVKPDAAEVIKNIESKKVSTFTVFAKMQDLNQLSTAQHLDNREFYFVDLDGRYENTEVFITEVMGTRYLLTVREYDLDGHSYVDNVTSISRAAYVSLRNTARIGFKYKYLEFQSPGSDMTWEVMVFMGKNGIDSPWVRMTIDTDSSNTEPRFPFDVSEFVIDSESSSDEEKRFVTEIWTKEYFRFDERDIIRTTE